MTYRHRKEYDMITDINEWQLVILITTCAIWFVTGYVFGRMRG